MRRPGRPRALGWIAGLALALGSGCAGSGGVQDDARPSRIESDPPGALVYLDEGFVGRTPASVELPARERVALRIELRGHESVHDVLTRRGAKDAGPGVGWQAVYFYPLARTDD